MILQTDEFLFTIVSYVSAIVFGVAISVIAGKLMVRNKTNALKAFFATFVSFSCFVGLEMFGVLLYVPLLIIVGNMVFLSAFFLFWMLFLDYVMGATITWQKMLVVGLVIAFLVTYISLTVGTNLDTMEIDPVNLRLEFPGQEPFIPTLEGTLMSSGSVFLFFTNIAIVIMFVHFFWWSLKSFKQAPGEMRRPAMLLFISGILGLVLCVLTILNSIMPGLSYEFGFDMIGGLMQFASIIILIAVIWKWPKIMHLLPYKVFYLIVTDKSGTPFFDHWWVRRSDGKDLGEEEQARILNEREDKKILFAGLLTALDTITKNTMKRGDIRELQLRDGVFLMNTWLHTINVGLLASKYVRSIRDSLDTFTAKFEDVFSPILRDENGNPIKAPKDISLFKDADDLVEQSFSNVPYFDEVPEKEMPKAVEDIL